MIIDTGVELIPGNGGKDCPGNGLGVDEQGNPLPWCCDECDYGLCCYGLPHETSCVDCDDVFCPRSPALDNTRKYKQ